MKDEMLISLIQTNPNKGIHRAMQLYGRSVNTICISVLQDCEAGLVDEAVAETFVKLWQKAKLYSAQEGYSLKSWVYSIARNTAIDIRRKNGYALPSLDDETKVEPAAEIEIEAEVQKRELRQILQEVIAELGEPDSQVFLMKYFLFMKNKDIAAKLQISEKRTENILYRGKRKLKELLIKRGITCYED